MAQERPMKEYRSGAISAAIWTTSAIVEGRSVERHNIRLQRRYRDPRSGEWKTTGYYQPEDLPKLQLVIAKAYEHVMLRETDVRDAPATP